MKRTKAQARCIRKGYTHEAAYWAGHRMPWNFILLLRPESAAYFRKNALPGDWVRPVHPQFIHNGRKPK